MFDDRAASETIGTILLVAVVVIAVGTLTAATLLDRGFVDEPEADVRVNVTGTQVLVNHTGGDALPAEELSVTVRAGTGEFAVDGVGGVGEHLDPGEGWTTAHGLSLGTEERVRVLVVHDDRTVLVDARRRVYPD